jgi:citrate lyase acyl carrier protein
MELQNSHAGTLESGDILIQVTPSEGKGIDIELESTVEYQFGRRIREVIKTTAEELGLTDAHIKAVDKGALDCTIKARTTAAVVRATGKDVWKD